MSMRRRASLGLLLMAALIPTLLAGPAGARSVAPAAPVATVRTLERSGLTPALAESLRAAPPGTTLDVIVTLREQAVPGAVRGGTRAARQRGVVTALQGVAERTQGPIRAFLEAERRAGRVERVTPYWVLNGLAVRASAETIVALAARADVASVEPDGRLTLAGAAARADVASVEPDGRLTLAGAAARGGAFSLPPAQGTAAPEANIARVGAAALWALGYRGQGVVVANMDTGVYAQHADLASRWRGGANSWFDATGDGYPAPIDPDGHGTATMSVLVGGDAGGSAIGMAPGAQWIAVRIFNDKGEGLVSAAHAGFQWLLDPDGNPATPDAPHVVSNSWGYETAGCYSTFSQDLAALRAAGILPVFSAGNLGPDPGTGTSPANNAGALPVGATDNADGIWPGSSRGPSACDPGLTFPALTAPGVSIRAAYITGTLEYHYWTGTSLAAPHVAGALALLLSALPDATVDQQGAALLAGAVDLGDPGPDASYGAGRLDVWAAYQILASSAQPGPTPPPPAYLPQVYAFRRVTR